MSKLTYGSVCSGIEAATAAWHSLGWTPNWFSEIEKFPSAVLAHHYPNVPNYGDMTKFKDWPNDKSIDLLVGGTPCQSFSVAGLRKGLDDPRGNLMLTYLAIAARYRPRWLAWENVPGVLSSNGGRDFGTFLWALGELGYGFAYRTLDAQYFGVSQRRRRVFVVGYLGDWKRAGAVLFERHSLSGNTAPRREKRQETPGFTSTSFGEYGEGVGTVRAAGGDLGGGSETLVPDVCPALSTDLEKQVSNQMIANAEAFFHTVAERDVTSTIMAKGMQALGARDIEEGVVHPVFIPAHEKVGTLTASYGMGGIDIETKPVVYGAQNSSKQGLSATPEVVYDTTNITSPTNGSNPQPGDPVHTLAGGQHPPLLTYGISGNWIGRKPENGGNATTPMHNVAPNLTSADRHAVAHDMKVRRLTPIECERLQGFPDNFTQIPYRNKDAKQCPDGPRYKAIGNSMAVPVMKWIGERINMVEDIS